MNTQIKDFEELTQKCKCCGRELPTSEFSRNRFGLVHICKECAKQHRSAGRKKTNEINDILRQLDDALVNDNHIEVKVEPSYNFRIATDAEVAKAKRKEESK